MSDGDVEIYRQRYEVWRHLDKLRVQMIQILIAIGSGAALTIRLYPETAGAWFWVLIGGSVLAISIVMSRVSEGVRANNVVLKAAGEKIGDTGIPDNSDLNKSAVHWLTLVICLIGILLIVKGVFLT